MSDRELKAVYQAGLISGLEGKNFWENPYTSPDRAPHYLHWQMGYCEGRQRKNHTNNFERAK